MKLTRSQSSRHYIRNINAGLRHTIVLTASLQLFGWGLLNFTTTSRSPAETEQLSALAPTVSFLPKNIDHFIPSTSADNLYLALAGSSSSSLSYVALDMCSNHGPPTHNNRNEKKTTSNPTATRLIGKVVRSLSKSPTRTVHATPRNDAVVSVQRRAARQQFNTILYKVDKPTSNASQVKCNLSYDDSPGPFTLGVNSNRMKRSSRNSRGSRAARWTAPHIDPSTKRRTVEEMKPSNAVEVDR